MRKKYVLGLILYLPFTGSSQVPGCTDPLAKNYNASATMNNGTCTYNSVTLNPVSSLILSDLVVETSGLTFWNGKIWTHNDNTDIELYGMDTVSGSITLSYSLTGAVNNDWEDISQDQDYLYIGDFGNNASGNRTNLKILRVVKNSLKSGNPIIEEIRFSYSNQTDFTTHPSNKTDFDCESFIVTADSIYLFSKQWLTNKTTLYSLPKIPGTYLANPLAELDVQGLITGAVYIRDKRTVALCGYTNLLQPFIWLLYDYPGNQFFNGNKRKFQLNLSFHQIEGICSEDGRTFYLSNEKFVQQPIANNPQKLHRLDLAEYLSEYYGHASGGSESEPDTKVQIFPVPTDGKVQVIFPERGNGIEYEIRNLEGKILLNGRADQSQAELNLSSLSPGTYLLYIQGQTECWARVIKN